MILRSSSRPDIFLHYGEAGGLHLVNTWKVASVGAQLDLKSSAVVEIRQGSTPKSSANNGCNEQRVGSLDCRSSLKDREVRDLLHPL